MRRLNLIAIPYLWLLALFLVPFLIVMKISLSEYALSIPPYSPYLDLSAGWAGLVKFLSQLDLENYIFLTTDDLYWKAYLSSLKIAKISTVITLLVGFPLAYGMARAATEWRPTLLMLVILPFWTSFLIRVYAWMGLLSQEGLISEDQLFYFESRGISRENAIEAVISGFCKEVFKQLPMEFAVEAQKLLTLKLEDSVG